MLTLLLASLLTTKSHTPADISHKFVRAVERRDVAALHRLISPEADLGDWRWRSVNEVLEKSHHIHVVREAVNAETTGGPIVRMEIRLQASGVTAGAPHRPVTLPSKWRLEIERKHGEWRIRSAMTEEQYVASVIVAQKTDADRRATLREAEVDMRQLPIQIATMATDRTDINGRDAVQFALTLSRENGDRIAESACLRLLSTVEVLGHDFAKAIESAGQSLEVARRAQSPDAECTALFALGIAEWLGDDFASALDHLENAGAMVHEIDDPRTAIKSIYMAGYILQRQGDLSAAIRHIQQSQELSRKYGWRTGVVDALLMIGTIHDQLQNVEIYSQLSRRAYNAAIQVDDLPRAAMALYNEAEAEARLEHFGTAIPLLQRVIQLASGGGVRASALDLLGVSLAARGHFVGAERALVQSLAISRYQDDRRMQQVTLTHLSDLRFSQSQLEEALTYARAAIDITAGGEGSTRNSGEFALPAMAWTAQGRVLKKLGRTDDAIAAFRHAVSVTEESRHAAPGSEETLAHFFSRGNAYPYLGLIDLLVQKNDRQGALILTEKIKARALRDAIEGGRVDLRSLMSADEKARERELDRKVAELSRARLGVTGTERARLDEAVQRAQDDVEAFTETLYAARTQSASAAESTTVTVSVPENAAILDYVVTEESTVVFGFGRETNFVKRLPIARRDLAALTRRFSRSLEQRDLRWMADARQLYDILLAPVARFIASKRIVCIVPDDVLWRVPFDALLRPDGRPLIETSAVFYSPSLAFLGASARRGGTHRSLLAVANPKGSSGRLPEAVEEVRAISALYQRSSVLTGALARETTVKQEAGKFDVLHFATHAVIDDRSPMFSSLVLTSDDQNDGFLQARELLRLNLHADLAVLSACETGRGAIYPGEGVVGLSWAFFFAGCPTSVVSRWRVNSRGTADIMIAFHRELVGHELPSAEALRRAALEIRKRLEYRHPYYWAAFQVVGVGW